MHGKKTTAGNGKLIDGNDIFDELLETLLDKAYDIVHREKERSSEQRR